ncbi:MAG TPA: hypothetical protein VI136_06225, partial [Verrucomicrobiae bacterium]
HSSFRAQRVRRSAETPLRGFEITSTLSRWPRLRGFFIAGLALGWLGSAAVALPFLKAEYRVDGGPPVAMSLVSSNGQPQFREGVFTASASAASLSVGPHYYEVRMQGQNGTWSTWHGAWFRVTGETHLTGAEWFVDSDPGYGLGIPIPLPADGEWDEPEEDFVVSGVTVTNLTEGRHQLIIRAKDSNGDWGIPMPDHLLRRASPDRRRDRVDHQPERLGRSRPHATRDEPDARRGQRV